jgi:hypothetical protein
MGSVRRVVWALAVLGLASAQAQAAGPDCRRIPVYSAPCFSQTKPHAGCAPIANARAPCFTVRGVLKASNGVPAMRLWRTGTKRILGIVGGDGDPAADGLIPEPLNARLYSTPGWARSATGDFRICPLATERPGWMQPVCLVGATHVSLSPVPPPMTNQYDPPPTPEGEVESRSPPRPR